MITKRHGLTVPALVRNLKARNYSFETIAGIVREQFPAQKDFTAAQARMLWAGSKPRDHRSPQQRAGVTVSLAGPSWSHPKRSA